jgi:hypothetical protein
VIFVILEALREVLMKGLGSIRNPIKSGKQEIKECIVLPLIFLRSLV